VKNVILAGMLGLALAISPFAAAVADGTTPPAKTGFTKAVPSVPSTTSKSSKASKLPKSFDATKYHPHGGSKPHKPTTQKQAQKGTSLNGSTANSRS
jgi:hypothetical protein